MERLSKIFDEKYASVTLIFLTLFAFAVRGVIFYYWMDAPGDGPTKAMYAYNWYKSPHIIPHGIWLPGFEYLTGSFSILVNNPLFSIRLLNLIAGTLTIPLLYLLVRKIYNHVSALFAGSILSFLPLHVGYSVSSLTEATFLFEIIAAILLLVIATERESYRRLFLVGSVFFIFYATMTRYEAWLLIPFFPCFYYWKTGRLRASVFMLIILSLFPVAWSISNYFHSGDFLLGITAAKDENWATETSIFGAVRIIVKQTIEQFGWALLIIILWGMILQFSAVLRKKINSEQVFLFAIAFFFWLVMLRFAMVRGETFQPRYLLFGLVLILPFAALPLLHLFKAEKLFLSAAIIFILLTFAFPMIVYYPMKDVTRKQPTAIEKVACWLKENTSRQEPILMTNMGGQSTYLPLYHPDIGAHDIGHFIYYQHCGMSDARLENYLRNRRPSLFITCDRDHNLQSKIERVWGGKTITDNLIHTEGEISIYKLTDH